MAQISRRQSTPIATRPGPYGAIQASQLTTAGQAGVRRTEGVCLCVEPCGQCRLRMLKPSL